MSYKKIMLFGRPGSGKSTFAIKLASILNLPTYHLDKYFFIANWAKRDYNEFMQLQQQIVESKEWIIDGNCTQSLEKRYQYAEICLYFNYPKILCLWRVYKRLFNKNSLINDRAHGCRETVRLDLIKYLWTFEKRVQKIIMTLKNKYPQVKFIEITNDQQLQQILATIAQNNN